MSLVGHQDMTFNSIKDYHIDEINCIFDENCPFNSIKDYQEIKEFASECVWKYFQFHQGLSRLANLQLS